MRPHVEFIHEDDYIWRRAELPGGEGQAFQRNLSVDEEDGSASLRVDFRTDFGRPPGAHEADTEWFVLEGEVSVGDRVLNTGGYFYAPAGAIMPWVKAKSGTRILLYREHGDWGFSIKDRANSSSITLVDAERIAWEDVQDPRMPDTGIKLKVLHRSPGHFMWLSWVGPGWNEERLIHHPVYEDCYIIKGQMDYNFGILTPGSYFFRPAWVKHGPFVATDEEVGLYSLVRCDGDVVRYLTVDSEVRVDGKALNYDPATEAPCITGIPTRSKSTGEWDGTGR